MNLTRRSGGSTPRRRGTVDDLLQIGNTGNPVPRLSFPIFLWEFTCTELEISGCRISPCRRACRPITANGQHCARAVPSKSKTGTWRRRPEAGQRGALGGSARSSLRACSPLLIQAIWLIIVKPYRHARWRAPAHSLDQPVGSTHVVMHPCIPLVHC